MRYYHQFYFLDYNWTNKLTNQLVESKKEQWILSQEGLYKYANTILHKFKLWLSDEELSKSDSVIKPSNMRWTKFDTIYNIPIQHKVLNMKISSFKLHPKSITTFIVEEDDNGVNDYYFESAEEVDNHSLLEDINSFLSLLK